MLRVHPNQARRLNRPRSSFTVIAAKQLVQCSSENLAPWQELYPNVRFEAQVLLELQRRKDNNVPSPLLFCQVIP